MNEPGRADVEGFLLEAEGVTSSEAESARSLPLAFSDLGGTEAVGADAGVDFALFVFVVEALLLGSPSYRTSTVGFLYGAGRAPF